MTPLKLDTKIEIPETMKRKFYVYTKNTVFFLLSLAISIALSMFTSYTYVFSEIVGFIQNVIRMPEPICPEIAFCIPSRQHIVIAFSIMLLQAVVINFMLIKIVKNIRNRINKEPQ